MNRILKRFVVLLLATLWIAGCDRPPSVEPSGRTIRVGIVAPFSGPDRAKGEEGVKGIAAAMKVLPLLQNGDRIEWVREDDGNQPARTARALKKLVEVDRVAAVVAFSGSGPVLEMARLADRYQTPILAVIATHPGVREGNGYISQICFDDAFQGQVAALYVRDELLLDRVAVFSNTDSAYSTNLADEFEGKFAALEGVVTNRILLSDTTDNYADVLARVRDQAPELLYVPVGAPELIRMLEASADLEWDPMLMAGDGLLATVARQYPDHLDRLEGMLATDLFHAEMPMTPIARRIAKAHDGPGTTLGALGAEAYSILTHAMNRCKNPNDRACINQMIRSTRDFRALPGKISIGPGGKAHRPLVINTIRNGRLHFVVKVY